MRSDRRCGWFFLLAGLIACAPGGRVDADAGVDAEVGLVGQGSPARGELVINEVAARPVAVAGAPGGDWIELVNRADSALDLCGFFITDSLDRLDHYTPLSGVMPPEPCEPVLFAPGAYLLIEADGLADAGPGHARFQLGVADEVHVVTIDGLAMDGLVYLYPSAPETGPVTLARSPDGQGLFFPAEPSPGAANPLLEETVMP